MLMISKVWMDTQESALAVYFTSLIPYSKSVDSIKPVTEKAAAIIHWEYEIFITLLWMRLCLPLMAPMLHSVSPRSSARHRRLGIFLAPMCLAVSGQDFWLGAMFSFSSKAAFPSNEAIAVVRLFLVDQNASIMAGFGADSCLDVSIWEREKTSWESDCKDSPPPGVGQLNPVAHIQEQVVRYSACPLDWGGGSAHRLRRCACRTGSEGNLHNHRSADGDQLCDTPQDGKGKQCEIEMRRQNLGLSHM